MISLKLSQSKTIPYLTSLILLFSSCFTQSQSTNDTQPEKEISQISITKNQPDTTIRLKFSSGIRAIMEDSKGNIWFGSHQEGVAVFDGIKFTYFSLEDGLSANQVRSIYEDSNGIIWFECSTGISSYTEKKIITYKEKNFNSINNWQSGKNDIWFKGDESFGYNGKEIKPGVYRYDGKQLNYHTFPIISKKGDEFFNSVSTPFVKGKNGVFWFGTYGAVFGYDGTSESVLLQLPGIDHQNFTIIDDQSLGYDQGFLHVRSIFEDSKGNLWIGNNGIGALLYDGKTTINFSEKKGLTSGRVLQTGGFHSPPGTLEHVFSIGEDHSGNIWFGDRDTGAWKYDGEYLKNYSRKDGLTCIHIWQIYNAKNGELWFAMDDGKVLKFNPTAEKNGVKSFERIF